MVENSKTLKRNKRPLFILLVACISFYFFINWGPSREEMAQRIFSRSNESGLILDNLLITSYLKKFHLVAPPPRDTPYKLSDSTIQPIAPPVEAAIRELNGGVIPKEGFFIECGANNGEFLSQTLKLEVLNYIDLF